jgi:zinc/manganese transport system permease protein
MSPWLAASPTGWSWDLADDVRALTQFAGMRHAFLAGAATAVMCGAIGWFVVLRGQAYAGHTLAVVAFPGATAAAYYGIAPIAGYFAMAIAGSAAITWLTRSSSVDTKWGESAAVGSIQAAALAVGVLFLSLYRGFLANTTDFLFGTFLGVTANQVVVITAVAILALVALAVMGRPLLFSSVDARVAAARGVPVRALGAAFLLLVALAVAEASQFTGVLLVFALLVAPAAAAQQMTARPAVSLAFTLVLALVATWGGLAAAFFTNQPPGFWVAVIACAPFGAARITANLRSRVRS